jgi:hypothetical protein
MGVNPAFEPREFIVGWSISDNNRSNILGCQHLRDNVKHSKRGQSLGIKAAGVHLPGVLARQVGE